MKTVLIVGCGDVMSRALPWLKQHFRVLATARDAERARALRAQGITPIRADLDDRGSLRRLSGIAPWVIHSAPPPDAGDKDARTRALVAALRRPRSVGGSLSRPTLRRFCYISTSGVYGDCQGEAVSESRPVQPTTARAKRRVDAESRVRALGRPARRASFVVSRPAARVRPAGAKRATRVSILRAPGIYAAERLPLARIARGDPVLRAADDVFTNHIHADDLARMVCLALFRAGPGRVFNASDDSELAMGEYFDLVADAYHLPRAPRVSRSEAALRLTPMTLSFMSESRRLINARIKAELRLQLRVPTVADALPHLPTPVQKRGPQI